MAFSKVTLNGDTLMDVTQKTVTAATMLSGTTALKNDGTDVTGNIPSKSSSDLTVSGATVTAPAGYYAASASKSVATGTVATPATTITANPSMSAIINSGKNLFDMDCLLEADGWVEDNGDYYGQIRRVLEEYPVGTGVPIYGGLKENTQYTVSLTVRIDSEEGTNNGLTVVAYYSDGTYANVCGALRNQTTWTRISGTTTSGKTVTSILISYSNGGVNVWHIKEAQIEEGSTLTDYTPYAIQANVSASVSASQSVTPTVSAGYVSSGTAGTVSVSGSGSDTVYLTDLVDATQSVQTIHPSTTDQTIASGTYLTGTQTIKAVTTTNLTAANIVSGVTVKIGDSTDDDCVASITGTHSGGLEYEEGTWTPSEDIAKPTISFANTHNSAPTSIIMSDATGTDDTQTYTNYGFTYNSFHSYTGEGMPSNTNSNARYGLTSYVYRGSGTNPSQAVLGLTILNNTSSSYAQDHWTTSSGFSPNSDSDARYWRANRTYKWIAVWASTT